jgi:hypothetical protein
MKSFQNYRAYRIHGKPLRRPFIVTLNLFQGDDAGFRVTA